MLKGSELEQLLDKNLWFSDQVKKINWKIESLKVKIAIFKIEEND